MLSTRPDCFADAVALLEAHNLTVERVVSVDRDSILYLNKLERPRTCWLHRPEQGRLRVRMDPGFVATEPEYWHEQLSGDRF